MKACMISFLLSGVKIYETTEIKSWTRFLVSLLSNLYYLHILKVLQHLYNHKQNHVVCQKK